MCLVSSCAAQAGKGAQLGRTVWGVLGIGGFGFHPAAIPGGKCVVVTTRSHSNKLVNDCVDAMMPDKVVRVGGAGNKVMTHKLIIYCLLDVLETSYQFKLLHAHFFFF